eukprot:TRINITY_DN59469_c0_g1_i1.p1 TRINITY_DN59469_c0_g1~~TRINITY_DN59469_c0_g1_i1.p1  ORF type:complete len:154 (+),score=23.08 TRINITY_DN59469_c0_g1_i1:32-463(+)
MFMPDLSDVGPPATGPGLPQRLEEAPPPPIQVHIVHGEGDKEVDDLIRSITAAAPQAQITTALGTSDSFEISMNDKLIYSKEHLGEYPDYEEIAEIIKWGNKGKSLLHMYLCSVAEGGEPRMVITDRKNTPLAKRLIMTCSIS